MLDATGFSGELLQGMNGLFFSGGALLVFIYLWGKGRLNWDEDPKIQMMSEDDHG